MRAAVIGGLNVDIGGTSTGRMLSGDSNPGRVSVSYGGVGRNIAENLARLGCEVELVTLLGRDSHTESILENCADVGISLRHADVADDLPNGTYLYLSDADGDLYAAVSDMRVSDRITPAWLAERRPALEQMDFVVLDANLPEEALLWAADNLTVPLTADPVSVKKAHRLRGILPRLNMVKPNRQEARLLTGHPADADTALDAAGEALLRAGVRNVFISLGAEGVYYTDGTCSGIQPCLKARVVNTSGCGDAFHAMAALALAEGMDIRQAALYGQAASAICAGAEAAVSRQMSMSAVAALCGRAFE